MKKRALTAFFLLFLLLSTQVKADEEGAVYSLFTQDGAYLTAYAGVPDEGDEYISGDNQHYRVVSVEGEYKRATLEALGGYALPDVSWLDGEALAVASQAKAIAIYCTHSDESYEPTDGTSSETPAGGIYDVAGALKERLEAQGVTVYLSDNTHLPHDAGAYRRSRSTAKELLQQNVDAILDIHRDGIPDPDEYAQTIGGEKATQVRLLVGRGNQNASSNKEFASQIKAVADKLYPDLIKDIYMGKGSYNQDLAQNAVLLEFGTHTISKERAVASTEYMAKVLTKTLYGGVSGAARGQTEEGKKREEERSSSVWPGIAWVLGLGLAAVLIFAFISTGTGKAAIQKVKRTFQEITLTGRRK